MMIDTKRSYIIELEVEDELGVTIHHVLCTVKGKPKISETIKSIGDNKTWKIISISEIDNDDAIELQKMFEDIS